MRSILLFSIGMLSVIFYTTLKDRDKEIDIRDKLIERLHKQNIKNKSIFTDLSVLPTDCQKEIQLIIKHFGK
jgi:hypothetical protein